MEENYKQNTYWDHEDDDMKIVGVEQPIPDDGELAAREFNQQKECGNIERAYSLGERLSKLLFTSGSVLLKLAKEALAAQACIQQNALILFAFVVDTVLENGCPNSILSFTALNYFHQQVEKQEPELYHSIQNSGAYSLYLLCTRDAVLSRACVGQAFAEACDLESDQDVIELGDRLAHQYYLLCKVELQQTQFV